MKNSKCKLDWCDLSFSNKGWWPPKFVTHGQIFDDLNKIIQERKEEMLKNYWGNKHNEKLIELLKHFARCVAWKNYFFLPEDNIKTIVLFWPDDPYGAMGRLEGIVNEWGMLVQDLFDYCPQFTDNDVPYLPLDEFTDFFISKKNSRSWWKTTLWD